MSTLERVIICFTKQFILFLEVLSGEFSIRLGLRAGVVVCHLYKLLVPTSGRLCSEVRDGPYIVAASSIRLYMLSVPPRKLRPS